MVGPALATVRVTCKCSSLSLDEAFPYKVTCKRDAESLFSVLKIAGNPLAAMLHNSIVGSKGCC